jgi:hypothetical protein
MVNSEERYTRIVSYSLRPKRLRFDSIPRKPGFLHRPGCSTADRAMPEYKDFQAGSSEWWHPAAVPFPPVESRNLPVRRSRQCALFHRLAGNPAVSCPRSHPYFRDFIRSAILELVSTLQIGLETTLRLNLNLLHFTPGQIQEQPYVVFSRREL